MQRAADYNAAPWSQAQKVIASLKTRSIANTPSYLNEKLTLWFPPADSTPFTTTTPDGTGTSGGFLAYPAPGTGQIVILAKAIDQGKLCVIRKMSIFNQGANPPDGSGNVVWRVLINGAAVKGMNAMLSQFGAGLNPQDCQIIATDGDVIQVTVEVPAGKIAPPGTTAARWDGYTCPLTEATLTK
jgi:hypothetical protein